MSLVISRDNVLFVLLLVFLLPISTVSGISANYSFVFLFLLCPFLPWGKMPIIAVALLVCYVVSYARGYLIISGFDLNFVLRQTFSFLVTVACVGLLFVRLPYGVEEICKVVLTISVVYSIWVITAVVVCPQFTLANPYYIKGGLREFVPHWPQRFPVVVMFAFFCALWGMLEKRNHAVFVFLLLGCLLLTLTRSIYISVSCGVFVFVFQVMLGNNRQKRIRLIQYMILFGSALVVICFMNDVVQQNLLRIFTRSFSSIINFLSGSISPNSGGSDAGRLYYWQSIFDIWSDLPLLGTGFANIYLFNPQIGSAHSQYMDVLLRTGIIGLGLYLYLWGRIMAFYWRSYPHIFSGLFAMFIYGLFNETTKLSYTGLLFFMLLNQVYTARADRLPRIGDKGTVKCVE